MDDLDLVDSAFVVTVLSRDATRACFDGFRTAPTTVLSTPRSTCSAGRRPARSSALAAWTSAMSIERCQAGGVSAKLAFALPALDEWLEGRQYRAVSVVQLAMWETRVDVDERAVAPERSPNARQARNSDGLRQTIS
jgi:hypothetical protein